MAGFLAYIVSVEGAAPPGVEAARPQASGDLRDHGPRRRSIRPWGRWGSPPGIWGPPGPWPSPPIAGIPGLPGGLPPVVVVAVHPSIRRTRFIGRPIPTRGCRHSRRTQSRRVAPVAARRASGADRPPAYTPHRWRPWCSRLHPAASQSPGRRQQAGISDEPPIARRQLVFRLCARRGLDVGASPSGSKPRHAATGRPQCARRRQHVADA